MTRAADVAQEDPGLRLLTGADAEDLLSAALTPAGAELLSWSVREVDVRPGRRTTASYVAKVSWPGGIREETLGASVRPADSAAPGPAEPEAGRLVLTDGERQVDVWRFPFDPELPALPAACYPESAAELLRRLGIDCPRPPRLHVVSYRPRKRAVVVAEVGGLRLYIKVLRPRMAADVRRRHDLLAGAGLPVPACLGWSDNGLIVLAELPGTPLGTAVESAGADACRPDELVRMLDGLPDGVRHLPRRRPWAEHVSHYAAVVGAALPAEAGRAHALAAEVESQLGDDGSGNGPGDEPTHGDFYESQLMVDAGGISGLLDIDTIGPGRRADDLACLLAHLSVRVAMRPDAANLRHAIEHWLPVFDARVNPGELRVRTAAVVMSLATGPFRAQEPGWERTTADRLRLVQEWLNAARR